MVGKRSAATPPLIGYREKQVMRRKELTTSAGWVIHANKYVPGLSQPQVNRNVFKQSSFIAHTRTCVFYD